VREHLSRRPNQAKSRESPRGLGRTIVALENTTMKTKTNVHAGQDAIDEALELLRDLTPPVNP
jgi:hypothetical protein